ncbi:hypothetical protein NH26_13560 [Flammeovirga pacifica]|uniref:Chalcone isomerase domain-containing protein n=2 Tax=Flammeovirga pacifica TaxID=915059 RepID=A0A1S1Z2G0_FLAPC|nr:hypothetical protein NH26_13560 [Flammeovirga pacifica]
MSFPCFYLQAQENHDVNLLFNVEYSPNINYSNTVYNLNGSGTYIDGIHKLFSCGLYLENKNDDALKIIYSDNTRIIDLVITSTQFQSHETIEEIKALHTKNKDLLKSGEFAAIFKNIQDSDVVLPTNFVETNAFFEKLFNDSNHGATDNYHSYIDDFIHLFDDKNAVGDQYRFVFEGNQTTKIYKKGIPAIEIKNKEFQKAVLNIFIGNHASNSSLKNKLLSQ